MGNTNHQSETQGERSLLGIFIVRDAHDKNLIVNAYHPLQVSNGKRFRCAKCRKRSPKPIKTPAPWYCPNCLNVGPANEGEIA
jgi:late competence protein required for DNA uptake (superfamily II DNA/RNA helicase)